MLFRSISGKRQDRQPFKAFSTLKEASEFCQKIVFEDYPDNERVRDDTIDYDIFFIEFDDGNG